MPQVWGGRHQLHVLWDRDVGESTFLNGWCVVVTSSLQPATDLIYIIRQTAYFSDESCIIPGCLPWVPGTVLMQLWLQLWLLLRVYMHFLGYPNWSIHTQYMYNNISLVTHTGNDSASFQIPSKKEVTDSLFSFLLGIVKWSNLLPRQSDFNPATYKDLRRKFCSRTNRKLRVQGVRCQACIYFFLPPYITTCTSSNLR